MAPGDARPPGPGDAPDSLDGASVLHPFDQRPLDTEDAARAIDHLLGGPPAPGRIGRFEVLGLLGGGAFGWVFRGRDPLTGHLVALKVPRFPASPDSSERNRFIQEGKAAQGFSHPNIVSVLEVGEHAGAFYIASEFVAGPTLRGWLRERPVGATVPPREAARLMLLLAQALDRVHERGVVHRDLKPENILLAETTRDEFSFPDGERRWVPRIADFGLASLPEDAHTTARSEGLVGTLPYAPPERLDDRRDVPLVAGDIYALGVILYELLVGQRPFQGHSTTELIRRILEHEPVAPRAVHPDLPRDLETICLKCLAKDPRRRYESSAALADDLRRVLNGEPIRARPISPIERIARWARRKPAEATLAGLALAATFALTFGAIAFAFNMWRRSESLEATNQDLQREVRRVSRDSVDQSITDALALDRDGRSDAALYVLEKLRENDQEAMPFGFAWAYLQRRFSLASSIAQGRLNYEQAPADYRLGWSYVFGVGVEEYSQITQLVTMNGNGAEARHFTAIYDQRYQTVKLLDPSSFQTVATTSGPWFSAAWPPLTIVPMRDGRSLMVYNTRPLDERDTLHVQWLSVGRAPELKDFEPIEAETLTTTGLKGQPYVVPLSKDRFLVAASAQRQARVWDARRRSWVSVVTFEAASRAVVAAEGPNEDWLAAILGADDEPPWLAVAPLSEPRMEVKRRWRMGPERSPKAHLAISPDGRHLATSLADGPTTLWDRETGTHRVLTDEKSGSKGLLAFSPDGSLLAFDSPNESPQGDAVVIYDPACGRRLGLIRAGGEAPNALCFTGDGRNILVIPSSPGAASICLFPVSRVPQEPPGDPAPSALSALDFEPGNRWFVVGDEDHTLRRYFWRPYTGPIAENRLSYLGDGDIASLAVSRDGRLIAVGFRGDSGSIRLFDSDSLTPVGELAGHVGSIRALAFAPDGQQLASAGDNGTVQLWDVAARKQVRIVCRVQGKARCVAFTRDGRRLACGGEDGALIVQDARSGQEVARFTRPKGVQAVAFSPDGERLAFGDASGALIIRDLTTGEQYEIDAHGPRGGVLTLDFHPNGIEVATGGGDGSVAVWDAVTGWELLRELKHIGEVRAVRFSPDGTRLLSVGADGRIGHLSTRD